MSTETLTPERTVKPQRHLTADEQAAIIAAVATGRTQTQVAKDFNVHRNTVYAIVKGVKALDHPANPLANGYKPVLERESVSALLRGLRHEENPYEAAKIGVSCMRGLGIFTDSIQMDAVHDIHITWGVAQEPEHAPVIDVTPVDSAKET